MGGIVRAGEHPASGALCLTLHGCQSPQIMRELMVGDAAWNIEENELSAERYLLAWFSLVAAPQAGHAARQLRRVGGCSSHMLEHATSIMNLIQNGLQGDEFRSSIRTASISGHGFTK